MKITIRVARGALQTIILGLVAAGCTTGPVTAPPAATASPGAVPSDAAITLTAPAEAAAAATFQVSWSGAETSGDFLVVVPAGAASWTESPDSPYVNATTGNPATLTAPKSAGAYEIWFMKGDTEGVQIIKARAPLTVH